MSVGVHQGWKAILPLIFATICCSEGSIVNGAPARKYLSHPPLRKAPPPSMRPMAKGPAYFVDAARGKDSGNGSKEHPWRTINHALRGLKAGDTLYLRGGTYYENVYCAAVGREDAPVTIRSYPGEQAVIDGSLREFFEKPADAWEPFDGGAKGEYRSKRRYRNIRQVIGSFGDSMIGLNTYFHAVDLRAESELLHWDDWSKRRETDCAPLYCGPGLWYDTVTGYIHIRLTHTHLPGVDNYRGETDPRRLPLVIAPFRSVPLRLDHARHVRLQDIVIRGAGYDAVILDFARDVEFDNVTIWCGTYGIRTVRTGPLRFYRSGLYGNCPPWLFRSDTSKRAYPGRPHRDITRLNTHSPWVVEAGSEFSVFATPVNDNWEVAYSEFTEAHDGPYFGGVSIRFHHNVVENMQDDGIYLSQMYPRHYYGRGGAEIHIYRNYFSGVLTALAFGGAYPTRDRIYIYRNIFDLRRPILTGRPSSQRAEPGISTGKIMGDHGSPPWPEMTFYHNTFVTATAGRFAIALLSALSKERPRKVYNNIVVSLKSITIPPARGRDAIYATDGNLYWSPGTPQAAALAALRRARKGPHDPNAVVADPKFVRISQDPAVENDYRLREGSPAVNAGVALPADWPDPLRERDGGKPDIGALPLGIEAFAAGRRATAGGAPR